MKTLMQKTEYATIILFRDCIPNKEMIKNAVEGINNMGIHNPSLSKEEVAQVIRNVESKIIFEITFK